MAGIVGEMIGSPFGRGAFVLNGGSLRSHFSPQMDHIVHPITVTEPKNQIKLHPNKLGHELIRPIHSTGEESFVSQYASLGNPRRVGMHKSC